MTVVPKDCDNKINSSVYIAQSFDIWHARLSHVNFDTLRKMINLDIILMFSINLNYKCETYAKAELTRTSFHRVERETEPLDLIHTDVCDLKICQTRGGKNYFITFIDDCTRYRYEYLRSKDEAFDMFKQYKTEVENQLNKKIKSLRNDRGGEYEFLFEEFWAEHGIIHQTTTPCSL